ncbi:MAG TPA: helix-turn-helix domain-containing protein [Pseudonocardiaceae bacterium]|nr:helix-turn-helix domain-containing protein [Pseudonocardiaceae bacterium]
MTHSTAGVNAVPERAYSRTLGNGLRLLELLHDRVTGLGVNEIAAGLGLHRTVVYRLLGTLRAHHLVVEQDGRYTLGLGLIELAGSVRADLRRAAEPQLATLAERVGATAFLTLADGDEAVSACVVEPRSARLHVGYRLGMRHPLTLSAAGLAILAGRPAQHGERPELGTARRRGYAATTGELEPGAWGLAVPLPDPGRYATASIGVVAMTKLAANTVAPAVREAVDAIAIAAGLTR